MKNPEPYNNYNSPREYFFIVDSDFSGTRLDIYLSNRYSDLSRSYLQKLIKNGNVLVNDETCKPSYKLEEGDEIFINIPPPEEWHIQPENIPLEIIYEDEYVAVINKPAGMVVHPGAGVKSATLVNALLYHIKDLSSIGGIIRPGIVHRLDKNTSGLMVVAKTNHSHLALQEQFKDRTISRKYLALVWGIFDDKKGIIEANIGRSNKDRKKMTIHPDGKIAITEYKVVKEYPYLSLIQLQLHTGRTHQIRVHMKFIHHPVFGDPEYNGRESQLHGIPSEYRKIYKQLLALLPYQFLHAFQLHFKHPQSNKILQFEVPLPPLLHEILSTLDNFVK